jgi:hypothetical protein
VDTCQNFSEKQREQKAVVRKEQGKKILQRWTNQLNAIAMRSEVARTENPGRSLACPGDATLCCADVMRVVHR